MTGSDPKVGTDQGEADGQRLHDLPLRDQFNAQPASVNLVLSWREGVPMRVSDLIRERVSLEWQRHNDLTDPVIHPLVSFVEGRRRPPSRTVRNERRSRVGQNPDDAVMIALDGFLGNAFFIIVDDTQVTDLDAEIRLTPITRITFVRLLPLVGG